MGFRTPRRKMIPLELKDLEAEYDNSRKLQLQFSDKTTFMAYCRAAFAGTISDSHLKDAPVFAQILEDYRRELAGKASSHNTQPISAAGLAVNIEAEKLRMQIARNNVELERLRRLK